MSPARYIVKPCDDANSIARQKRERSWDIIDTSKGTCTANYLTRQQARRAAEQMNKLLDAPALAVGDRVRLRHNIDRYPHFVADKGRLGTVSELAEGSNTCTYVVLDEYLSGAEEWDNSIQWSEYDEDPRMDLDVLVRASVKGRVAEVTALFDKAITYYANEFNYERDAGTEAHDAIHMAPFEAAKALGCDLETDEAFNTWRLKAHDEEIIAYGKERWLQICGTSDVLICERRFKIASEVCVGEAYEALDEHDMIYTFAEVVHELGLEDAWRDSGPEVMPVALMKLRLNVPTRFTRGECRPGLVIRRVA